jgi:hypothetical protein
MTWPAASDAGTGIRGYEIRRTASGSTKVLGRDLTTRSIDAVVPYGLTSRDTVRATDGAGNVGGPAIGPSFKVSLYGDGSSLTRYSSGWKTVSSSGATGKVLHTSSKAGAWMTFTFTGRSVAWVAPKGASRGSVNIYVDGAYVKSVSLYRASALSRVTMFSMSWPESGAHTVKIVVAGTPGHPRVDIDAFVVVR